MTKLPRRLWLDPKDVWAVDLRMKAVLLRAVAEPRTEQVSDLDIPVTRINKTTYRLDRSRLPDGQFSLFCPILTVFNQGAQ